MKAGDSMRISVKCALISLAIAIAIGPLSAEADASSARISLITILPGRELYSSFGHTAIRVVDGEGRDRLYNYGLSVRPFDLRFALGMLAGRMDFMVEAQRTRDSLEYYSEMENRGIVEQSLNLDEGHRKTLAKVLERGAHRENREYNYRYFTDNCATKPAEILRAAIGDTNPPFASQASKTLRSSVAEVLAPRPWLSLAISVLLGPAADKPIPNGPIFLPQDLMRWAAQASYAGADGRVALVSRTETLYEARPAAGPRRRISPLLVAIVVFALAAFASLPRARLGTARQSFDALLFIPPIALWLAILVFWLSAGYGEVGMNFNFLWAGPLPLAALAIERRDSLRPLSRLLFRIAAAAAGIAALGGGFGIQSIPAEARLFAAALFLRCAIRGDLLPRRFRRCSSNQISIRSSDATPGHADTEARNDISMKPGRKDRIADEARGNKPPTARAAFARRLASRMRAL